MKKELWDKENVIEANKLPNACMQARDEAFGNFSGSQIWNPNAQISEECSYLNVYRPRTVDPKVLQHY